MASRTPAENLKVPDFLKMFEASLVKREVDIVEFCESDQFCNPPDAPIWMADLSFKPIGEISIGDRIMGWQSGIKSYKTMCSAEVLDVKVRYASIVKVTMESGKSFRCTPDHQWLTGSLGFGKKSKDAYIKQGNQWFGPPKIGRSLVHVIDSPPNLDVVLQQQAFWLGGIYDGEGSCSSKHSLQIGQSKSINPEVYEKISEVLTNLGFTFTKTFDRINLTQNKINRGQKSDFLTVQALTNFINWCKPVKTRGIYNKVIDRRMWRNVDRIISIEPDGYGKVIGLTTSTGNYICHGYASKNCGKKLYPKQRTLLKLIFLEELDVYDKNIINEWVQSSKTGGEVTICPNIFDRYDYLRERKYPHFQRIVLVGGRRSGKGFITGLALAKKIYDLTLLDNVGGYYGVDEDKDIHIQIVANSKEQAKEMQFADATNCILSCQELIQQGLISKVLAESTSVFTPYDKKRIMRIEETQGKIDKDLAKIRLQAQGTNSRTLRGQASLIYVFDEFAHFLSGESNMSSDEIYAAAIPSLIQFGKDSMVFLNSSPYTEVGKFFEVYNESLKLDPPDIGMPVFPDLFMLQYPSWELYSGWKADPYWCDFLIKNDKGPPAVSPDATEEQLTTSDEKIKAQQMRFEEKSNPESFAVEYRCLDPNTRVLCADFTWQKIKDLRKDQEIIGFDEEPLKKGTERKLRTTKVIDIQTNVQPAYRLTFDDGTDIVCSRYHRWLSATSNDKNHYRWRSLFALPSSPGPRQIINIGDRIRFVVHPWEEDRSWSAGYLAGIFDGEGSVLGRKRSEWRISFTQKENDALDLTLEFLLQKGFTPKLVEIDNRPSPVNNLVSDKYIYKITGFSECLRFLGQIGPVRLKTNARKSDFWEDRALGHMNGKAGFKTIVSIEELPEQELVDIETTTGTFIAEGLISHNSRFAKVVDAFLNPEMVDRAFDPTFTKSKIGRYLETEQGARGHAFMYKGHGDPSSVVANFGVAIAHVEHFDEEVDDPNGNKFIIPVPHVIFDFVHAFYPEDFPDNTIDWMEVLPQITRLINAFRPVEWTFDQFNSTFAIQKLQSDLALMGIVETQVYEKAATSSTNRRVSLNFKTALNLGRVHFPHPTYPKDSGNKRSLDLVRQELKFLQEKNGKVDKQDIGPCRTSDIADCAFECVDFLIGDSLTLGAFADIKPAFGGLTGYGIGGKHDNPFQSFYDQNVTKGHRNLARGGRLNGNRRNTYGR